jgi:hypothetical protein
MDNDGLTYQAAYYRALDKNEVLRSSLRAEVAKREEAEKERDQLKVDNAALQSCVGNLQGLLPDVDDAGVVQKISELEELRAAALRPPPEQTEWGKELLRRSETAERHLSDFLSGEIYTRALRRAEKAESALDRVKRIVYAEDMSPLRLRIEKALGGSSSESRASALCGTVERARGRLREATTGLQELYMKSRGITATRINDAIRIVGGIELALSSAGPCRHQKAVEWACELAQGFIDNPRVEISTDDLVRFKAELRRIAGGTGR